MKLSEAIRLNGMMKPQGWGPKSMISLDAPCALGGALQAIGKQPKKWRWHAPKKELLPVPTVFWAQHVVVDNWPFTLRPAECPCGSDHKEIRLKNRDKSLSIFTIIILLNDFHGWTLNQIADWVATVEPAEEVKAEEEKQEVWRFVRK